MAEDLGPLSLGCALVQIKREANMRGLEVLQEPKQFLKPPGMTMEEFKRVLRACGYDV